MKLKTIKSKTGNVEYNEMISRTIELIKSEFELNLRFYHLFFLCWKNNSMWFLYLNTVIVVSIELKSKPVLETIELDEIYTIKLLKKYPRTKEDIEFKTVLNRSGVHWFKPEIFLDWIDEPSQITENIDNPYYEIISYLKEYNKNIFSTGRYLFYPKADGDSNFILNLYAFDKKNKTEMKLYVPDKCVDTGGKWEFIPPESVYDVVIDDLGNNLSDYQKLQCKKVFLEFANQENEYFKVKNYWVLELLKLTIQPVDILHEWSYHRCFSKPNLFGYIWVFDFPEKDEKPSFFITDSPYLGETTKVATINFKSPTYAMKKIFKRGNVKRKSWKLNKQEIKELMEFFNKPSERAEDYGSGQFYDGYKKYVKTNWQQLIFEYNHNTAAWGWGEKGFDELPCSEPSDIEQLPFELPTPDYTELL